MTSITFQADFAGSWRGLGRRLAALVVLLPLVGCSSVASWPGAVLEGNHYEVERDQVTWVRFVDRPQMRLDRTYDRTVRLVPADAASFRILENRRAAVDRDHVFCDGKVLDEADPASVRVVPGPDPIFYLADRKRLWRDCWPLSALDGVTFERLAGSYGRDARHVYSDGYVIEGADPATFRVITDHTSQSGRFGTDGKGVWTGAVRLPVVNPAGFRHLGHTFSTDGVVVLAGLDILEGADAATFRVTALSRGRDRSGCWGPVGRLPC